MKTSTSNKRQVRLQLDATFTVDIEVSDSLETIKKALLFNLEQDNYRVEDVAITEVTPADEGISAAKHDNDTRHKEGLSVERDDCVEDEHLDYLNELRESGQTNMFGAVAWLIDEFAMTKKTAKIVLAYWMKTFER